MRSCFIAPLALQGILMAIDEFYFHLKRGLPKWERLGHPIDTLSFLTCCCITLISEEFLGFASAEALYVGTSVVSCLMITKDEFIHTRLCSGFENWLHSCLFILHPVVLYVIWQLRLGNRFDVLKIQTMLVSLFLTYQVVYWWQLRAKVYGNQ